jgi:hypothetical protein
MTELVAYVGRSPDGARRVYGQAEESAGALLLAREAARDYLKGRPDCGPFDQWSFLLATNADLAAVQFARDVP